MSNPAEDAKNYLAQLIKNGKEENPQLLGGAKDFTIFTFLCCKYFYSLEPNDAYACIVDGKDDGSVDAILSAPEEDGNPIYFIQTKYRGDFDITTAQGELSEMEQTAANLRRMHFGSIREEVRNRFEDCKDDTNQPIKYVYFTLATPTTKKKEKARKQLIGDNENIEIIFGDEIQDYIECELKKTTRVPDGQLKMDQTGNSLRYGDNAVVVNISALSLKTLYSKYRRALLGLNLRYYVRNKDVDKGLKESITEHPEKFWYLNNGLVIVCEDFEIDGNIVKFRNFSIVNGGQTTDRIYNIDFDDDFYITCKIIRIPEESDSTTPVTTQDIAVATNSQKPIRPKDIVANRPEQLRLVEEFKKCSPPIQYITKNGEKIEKQYKDINQHITLDQLGKLALASVLQMPWTRTGFNNLYKLDEVWYNRIYKQQTGRLQVYADILRIDNYYKAFINTRPQTSNPKLTRNGRTYAIAAITFASLFMQNGIHTDVQKIENSEDRQDDLTSEIARLDRIIVNHLDDEEKLFTDLFVALSDEIMSYQFDVENIASEGELDESNFLKKKEPYLKSLKRLLSKLSNPGNTIQRIAEDLFKPQA